jgi:hypothetical protein
MPLDNDRNNTHLHQSATWEGQVFTTQYNVSWRAHQATPQLLAWLAIVSSQKQLDSQSLTTTGSPIGPLETNSFLTSLCPRSFCP